MDFGVFRLANRAACSFLPSAIMPGRAAKDIVLTINTTASSAAMSQSGKFDLAWMSMTELGLVGVVVIAVPRKRQKG